MSKSPTSFTWRVLEVWCLSVVYADSFEQEIRSFAPKIMPLEQNRNCVTDITVFPPKKRARRRLKAWMRARAPNVLHITRLGIYRHKAEWAAAGTLPGSPATITRPWRTRHIFANHLRETNFRPLNFRFWKISKKWLICTFFGEKKKIKISDTWGFTLVAGPIFETKNRAIFLERFFLRGISGEALLPLQLCSH